MRNRTHDDDKAKITFQINKWQKDKFVEFCKFYDKNYKDIFVNFINYLPRPSTRTNPERLVKQTISRVMNNLPHGDISPTAQEKMADGIAHEVLKKLRHHEEYEAHYGGDDDRLYNKGDNGYHFWENWFNRD